MEFRKTVTATLYARQQRDTNVKNRLLDSVGEREGGTIWENSIETYTTICEIGDQSKFDAWNRALKASALGQPEEWNGEGGGSGVKMVGHMYTHVWFMLMYGKNHHNIVK